MRRTLAAHRMASHERDPAPASPQVSVPDGFGTTCWSIVLAVASPGRARNEALEKLCRAYWRPAYVYARRRGLSVPDAEDATQSFFAAMLGTGFFEKADPDRGKFRAFLLTAFRNHLTNLQHSASAQKRGGGAEVLAIDSVEAESLLEHASPTSAGTAATIDPAASFDRSWALTVMERAIARLEAEQQSAGRAAQFLRLRAYLGTPPEPGDYERIAGELGMARATVPVLVHRLTKRYRELIRAEIAETVANGPEIDAELRHLFAALAV